MAGAHAAAQTPGGPIVDRCGSDVDAGGGTNLASALAEGGHIRFHCGGAATIKITERHPVTASLTIDGGGTVTLDGGGATAFLVVAKKGLDIGLEGVSLRGFVSANGGSVVAGANAVKIKDSAISNSFSPLDATTVTADNGQFTDNAGIVINAKSVLISNSAFKGNRGSPIEIHGGEATIADSVFEANGPTAIEQCTRFAVTRTRFSGNADAVRVDCPGEFLNATFESNTSKGDGGAIFIGADAGRVAIVGSRFTGNTAQRFGGAVVVDAAKGASLSLTHTIFKLNQAGIGGAIFIGPDTLPGAPPPGVHSRFDANAVTFVGNVARERGGAIAAQSAQIDVFRGFFLRNVGQSGGAVWSDPAGAPASLFANSLFVLNESGDAAFLGRAARFANATILGTKGAGVKWLAPSAATADDRPISIGNTIVENNSGGNCVVDAAHLVADGANLQFPGDSCGPGATVAPGLLDTFYAPLLGGAARAKGADALCANAEVRSVDAYGEARPKANHCSIGAVEGDLAKKLLSLQPPSGVAPDPGHGHSGIPSATAGEGSSGASRDHCPVTSDAPPPPSNPSALLARLLAAQIDYSVGQPTLEDWLVDPKDTPYPAVAGALLRLLAGKALSCPVFIDVVVADYQKLAGGAAPTAESQIRPDLLATALVQGFNERHGAKEKRLQDIIANP